MKKEKNNRCSIVVVNDDSGGKTLHCQTHRCVFRAGVKEFVMVCPMKQNSPKVLQNDEWDDLWLL